MTAFGQIFVPGIPARTNADLSSAQYKFINAVSGGKVGAAADATKPLLVMRNKPKKQADAEADLCPLGTTTKLKVDGSGSAIAVGDLLTADSSGRGIKAGAGDFVGAVALGASSAANDILEVLTVFGKA